MHSGRDSRKKGRSAQILGCAKPRSKMASESSDPCVSSRQSRRNLYRINTEGLSDSPLATRSMQGRRSMEVSQTPLRSARSRKGTPPTSACDVETSKVLSCYAELLEDSTFCDIYFVTGDEERLGAHKSILSARCAYFKSMLTSGLKESIEDPVTISIEESKGTLQAFLRFIYTGELLFASLTTTELMELFDMAHRYDMQSLVTAAKHRLAEECGSSLQHLSALLVWASSNNYKEVSAMAATMLMERRDSIKKDAKKSEAVMEVVGESKAAMTALLSCVFA